MGSREIKCALIAAVCFMACTAMITNCSMQNTRSRNFTTVAAYEHGVRPLDITCSEISSGNPEHLAICIQYMNNKTKYENEP